MTVSDRLSAIKGHRSEGTVWVTDTDIDWLIQQVESLTGERDELRQRLAPQQEAAKDWYDRYCVVFGRLQTRTDELDAMQMERDDLIGWRMERAHFLRRLDEAERERDDLKRQVKDEIAARGYQVMPLREEVDAITIERDDLRQRLAEAERHHYEDTIETGKIDLLATQRRFQIEDLQQRLAECEAGARALRGALRRFMWTHDAEGQEEGCRCERCKEARAALADPTGKAAAERAARLAELEKILASDVVWSAIRHLSKYPSDWLPDDLDEEPFDALETEVRRLHKERKMEEPNEQD